MWDQRYNTDTYQYGTIPNEFLAANHRQIPVGKVICLAEGEGRNAVYLAKKGYDVTAVDQSAVGLAKGARLAATQGVSVNWVHADLEDYDLGSEKWQGIVAVFCHLPVALRVRLHQNIPQALTENGVFLMEAYHPDQLKFRTGGPGNEAMLISADNMRLELKGLKFEMLTEVERKVVEGQLHTGLGAVTQLIARKTSEQTELS